MMSGTRSPVRNIRRGEEGVRASDLGPSENRANETRASQENFHSGFLCVAFTTSFEQPVFRLSSKQPEYPDDNATG